MQSATETAQAIRSASGGAVGRRVLRVGVRGWTCHGVMQGKCVCLLGTCMPHHQQQLLTGMRCKCTSAHMASAPKCRRFSRPFHAGRS